MSHVSLLTSHFSCLTTTAHATLLSSSSRRAALAACSSALSRSHQVRLRMEMVTTRIPLVMSNGTFCHRIRYMGKMVRQSWAMMPVTMLKALSRKLRLGAKVGSAAITRARTGPQKPQGRTVL